jgi:hypothetical protein
MLGQQLAQVRDRSLRHFDHWKKANARASQVNQSPLWQSLGW